MKEIMAHLTTLVDTYYIYGNTNLDNLLKWSNNCYNEANYLFRQRHFKNIRQYKYDLHLYKVDKLKEKPKYGKDYTATELTRLLKKQSLEGQNTLYRDCINIKISNSVVKDVKRNWSNYYKSLSDYKKHPYKYLGKPKFPKYLRKGKRHSTELDTQTIRISITKDDFQLTVVHFDFGGSFRPAANLLIEQISYKIRIHHAILIF